MINKELKMNIEINSQRIIAEVQKTFNEAFPYLKIEFFTQPHLKGKATSNDFLVSNLMRLGEFGNTDKSGSIEVIGSMKVSALEKILSDRFGLYAQVLRRSGKIWLETTATDDWTLDTQNEEGRDFTDSTREDGDIPDYHEQE